MKRITLGNRSGDVMYLDDDWQPVSQEDATLAKVHFDDGTIAFYTVNDKSRGLARKERPIHAIADSFRPKVEVALRYAFALGRKAIDREKLNAAKSVRDVEIATKDAADAVQDAVLDVLPSVLAELATKSGSELKTLGGPGSGNFGHAGRPGEVGGSASGVSETQLNEKFPIAGQTVDGLTVRDDVPNMGSIGSSLTDYEILEGIREVKVSDFEDNGKPSFYSTTEEKRVKELASQIQQTKEITPLIVVFDGNPRGPYVLEGGHRFDALKLNGAISFPALVVVDTSEVELRAGAEGDFVIRKKATIPRTTKLTPPKFDTSRAETWALQHVKELAKDLAKTTRKNLVSAVEQAFEDIDKGKSWQSVQSSILDAVGDDTRAQAIAETEIMAAANAGQRLGWEQQVESGFLSGKEKRVWVTFPDACPLCDDLEGETADLDGEYPDGIPGPPLHPRCRCIEELR